MTLLQAVIPPVAGCSANPLSIVALAALFSTLAWYLIRIIRSSAAAAVETNATIASEKTRQEEFPPGFDCMGQVEPLPDLDWKTERPERIYKFADRYNLTMGLRKTSVNTITRIDQQYAERIGERKKILDQYPGALGCMPCGEPMVRELYEFLITHLLPKRYPTVFALAETTDESGTMGKHLYNKILDQKLPLESPADIIETLRIIALTVDEDFLMLQPDSDGDGYQLAAFVWLYPVGFDPVEKLGIKLRDAHKPVPGFKQHLEKSMDRYFARLQPGSVVDRVNWAVATNSQLCERGEYHLHDDNQVSAITAADVDLDDTWVRCELQTLFALPHHNARILSVHLYLYPIREIKQVGLADTMVRAIDGYSKGNVPAFSRYKRIPVWGEVVKEYLRSDEDLPPTRAEASTK